VGLLEVRSREQVVARLVSQVRRLRAVSRPLKLTRGRYTIFVWPPFTVEAFRSDEGLTLLLAWMWRCRRWRFPAEPRPKIPTLVQGFQFGPIDARRMARR
jgi:hypothetical protein